MLQQLNTCTNCTCRCRA